MVEPQQLIHREGVSDALWQLRVLLWKNFLLITRWWKSTILQLSASFLFLTILYILSQTLGKKASTLSNPVSFELQMPGCVVGNGRESCYTLVYAPNSDFLEAAVEQMIASSQLPREQFRGFSTVEDMAIWIFENQNMTQAALAYGKFAFNMTDMIEQVKPPEGEEFSGYYGPSFVMNNDGTVYCNNPANIIVEYELWLNETTLNEAPIQYMMYQNTVEKALVSNLIHQADPSIAVNEAYQPTVSNRWLPADTSSVDFNSFVYPLVAPAFFYCAVMFNFIAVVNQIVFEKDLRLRQGLKSMGVRDSVYWLAWFIIDVGIAFTCAFLTCMFGYIYNFDMFRKTNVAVQFLMFFLFGTSMIPVAFFTSVFIQRTRTALFVGVGLFAAGFILAFFAFNSFILQVWFKSTQKGAVVTRWLCILLLPPLNFGKLLSDINHKTSCSPDAGSSSPSESARACTGDGFAWSDLYEEAPEGMLPVASIWWLLFNTVFYYLLSVYFDALIPNEFGVAQPFYFVCDPVYWGLRKRASASAATAQLEINENGLDPDVVQEMHRARDPPAEARIVVRNLHKHFYPSMCSRRTVHAVNGLWLTANNGEILALLGHNGAGKTTSINILTGLTSLSTGSASVCGFDVCADLDGVRRNIGVCPQHDILWDDLTAREHLLFVALLKGIPAESMEVAIQNKLSEVKLLNVQHKASSTFSGGMKRRLSVAMATLGSPRVVFLDEPTTGMDPVNRRHVWSMIAAAKEYAAVILTTHSMEEADALGDRIAIMNRGTLQCIGESLHLKAKFGSGYRCTLMAREDAVDAVIQDAKAAVPHLSVEESNAGSIVFSLLPIHVKNMPLFIRFAEAEVSAPVATARVHDWGVSHSTLEEVFHRLGGEQHH